MAEKPKYYITTAIAYTSGKPHIGNTYEIVLADAIGASGVMLVVRMSEQVGAGRGRREVHAPVGPVLGIVVRCVQRCPGRAVVEGELELLDRLVPRIGEALQMHRLGLVTREHYIGGVVQHAAVGLGVHLARAVIGELAQVHLVHGGVFGLGHEREVADALHEIAAGGVVHPHHAGIALGVRQHFAVHLRDEDGIVVHHPIDGHLA